MAQQTTTEHVDRKPQDQAGVMAPAVAPEVVPLEQIVKQIRRDSRSESAAYLNETTVPFGGE